jgi:hypothetical protein
VTGEQVTGLEFVAESLRAFAVPAGALDHGTPKELNSQLDSIIRRGWPFFSGPSVATSAPECGTHPRSSLPI